MMKKKYDAAFKVKVAIEAIKEQMTHQELAKKYEVHPVQVSQGGNGSCSRKPMSCLSGRTRSMHMSVRLRRSGIGC